MKSSDSEVRVPRIRTNIRCMNAAEDQRKPSDTSKKRRDTV